MRINEQTPSGFAAPRPASDRSDFEYVRDGVELVERDVQKLRQHRDAWQAALRGSVVTEAAGLMLGATALLMGADGTGIAVTGGLIGLAGAAIGYTWHKLRGAERRLDQSHELLSHLTAAQGQLAPADSEPGGEANAILAALASCRPEGRTALLTAAVPSLSRAISLDPSVGVALVQKTALSYHSTENLPLLQILAQSSDRGEARLARLALRTAPQHLGAQVLHRWAAARSLARRTPWPQSLLNCAHLCATTSGDAARQAGAALPYLQAIGEEKSLPDAMRSLAKVVVTQASQGGEKELVLMQAAAACLTEPVECSQSALFLDAVQAAVNLQGLHSPDSVLAAARTFLKAVAESSSASSRLARDFLAMKANPEESLAALSALLPMLRQLEGRT